MADASIRITVDSKGIREYIDSQVPEYVRAVIAERDAALAAVQAVRAILLDVRTDSHKRIGRALSALGTVGQPQEDPSHD